MEALTIILVVALVLVFAVGFFLSVDLLVAIVIGKVWKDLDITFDCNKETKEDKDNER